MSSSLSRREMLAGMGAMAFTLLVPHPVFAAAAKAVVCGSCHIQLGDNHCVKCGSLDANCKPAVVCSSCHMQLGDNHCVKCGSLDANCKPAVVCGSCHIKLGDNHCVKCGNLT